MSTAASPNDRRRVSVSLSKEAHEVGKENSRRQNRNFSNYLETLIFQDSENEPPRSAQTDG